MNRGRRRGHMNREEAQKRTLAMLAAGLEDYDRYATEKRQRLWDALELLDEQVDDTKPWLERVQLHDEWLAGLFVQLDLLRRGLLVAGGLSVFCVVTLLAMFLLGIRGP